MTGGTYEKITFVLLAATLAITTFGFAPSKSSSSGFNAPGEMQIVERRKKRIKGGSCCADPGDAAEHPECR
jgi:hypothetical protein